MLIISSYNAVNEGEEPVKLYEYEGCKTHIHVNPIPIVHGDEEFPIILLV